MDAETKETADDLREALAPLDAHVRAMFGGYCFYVAGKVVGLVCDGRIFVKRSSCDGVLSDISELAPAYPGAKDTWRLPAGIERDDPERLLTIVHGVAEALPPSQPRTR